MSRGFRLRSFAEACNGILVVLRTQPNARIHAAAAAAAVAMGCWLGLNPGEWAAVVCAIALVWTAEALNTAVELVVDLVSPERQRLAGWAKDVAAGAVLLAAVGAVAVGLCVFGGKLWGKAAGHRAWAAPSAEGR
jgi:diacylglycerol kinase (ATP)